MPLVEDKIPELACMKSYPKELFYAGDMTLLTSKKISIVGSRKPSKYSKEITYKLASALGKSEICVVSGGAMGIDAIAHMGAGSGNTISVLPCGIDIKYPAVNKNLLTDIQNNGLLLSQFSEGFKATPWSFVLRNEVVVALGHVLVVAEAELDSGSMRSIEFALKMKKEIFVLPQRIGESGATNALLKDFKAKAIYDIDEFVSQFSGVVLQVRSDDFLSYCNTNPIYDEALSKYPNKIFEAELSGEIEIRNGKIFVI